MLDKKLEIKASGDKKPKKKVDPAAIEILSPIQKINNWLAEKASVGVKDKVVFFRLLSTMINSGMSLIESLEILRDQAESPKLQLVISRVIKRTAAGSSLSDAMSYHPDVFDVSSIGIIKAGEKSGKLNTILTNLADQIENFAKLSGKIKGALMYPAVIMIIVVIAIVIIMTTVIPQIKEMFTSMGAKLPFATQLLIDTSDFLLAKNEILQINNLLLLIGLIIVLFIGFIKLIKTKKGSYYFSLVLLRIPLIKTILQKMIIAKFCRGMSILIGSGMGIIEVLGLISNMLGHEAYRIRTNRIAADVMQGLTMSQNMKRDVLYYPPMLVSMIAVGEKTAKLEEVTLKVADFYENEVNTIINNLMSLLEPLIIVVVGGSVGGIIIAIMLPIMSISDLIG